MGSKSPEHINLRTLLPCHADEADHLSEQFAHYYFPAYYPVAQLACLRLSSMPDFTAKNSSKISPTANTPLRFCLHTAADGVTLEIMSTKNSPTVSPNGEESSERSDKAFLAFLNAAIPKIIAQQASDANRVLIDEKFEQAQRRLAEEMIRQLADQQRRWMKTCADRRLYARQLEKRERIKEEIKKEEEKKQEMRLAIQRVEEPKRQSQRLSTQKEESYRVSTRTCLQN
jgi:hypothetical protein